MRSPNFVKSTEFEAEYDPSLLVQDTEKHVRWYVEESVSARRELSWSLDVPYGRGADETLDIVAASQQDSAVIVFLHGGYWQSFSSKEFSFVARGLHAHGLTVVVPNHSPCPRVTIADITQQSRRAIAWIHEHVRSFHGDPGRIFVVGHSAGGHQVAMLASTPWFEEFGLPRDVIKGAMTISGIFDLRPLLQCSIQKNLGLTDEIVRDQSPIFHVPDFGPPLLVSFGAAESSEFRRQSTDYLATWRDKGLSGTQFVQSEKNHFNAIEGLGDAQSDLCKRIVAFIDRAESRDKTTGVRLKAAIDIAKSRKEASANYAHIVQHIADAQRPAIVGNRVEAPTTPLELPVVRADRQQNLAISFAQERLWFIDRLFPGAVDYNEPILIRMDGPVDVPALEKALTEILRRHEAWRTVFSMVDGRPTQRILPSEPFQLDVVDGSHWPLETRDAEIQRVSLQHARLPFVLARGPLVRALLIQVSETEQRLVVTAHHIVVDGVSFFNVFLPELSAIYAAFSRGEPSPLAETSLHYADFAAWQRQWLTEATLAPKLAYWRDHLSGFSELELPIDFPRPQTPTGQGARVSITVPADIVGKVRALGKSTGVSLFTTLLAVWKTLLFRYSGQGDIIVGSAAAGRPRAEFEGLIGFFNNNLVLRTQLDGAMPFVDLLPKVAATLAAAREHQDVPFDRLVVEVGARRGPHKNPLFNNTFILMPPIAPLSATPAWSAGRIDIGVAKVDLYLELHQRSSGLVGHIEYRTELFAQETIERMVSHFGVLLEAIVRDAQQRLDELPLVTAAEMQQLASWQGVPAKTKPEDAFVSLEGLFEAQVDKSPLTIAIEQDDVRVTYADLDARANRLAHYLRSLGVRPETVVGLCLERSIDALTAILGVLKSGAAYVPLDPTSPSERLRFMIDDAGIDILLTNRKNGNVLPEFRGRTIVLDDDRELIASRETSRPEPLAGPEHLAYIIYTSGSTGRPKGVMVERRGLFHLAKAQERIFGLGVGSRVLQFFSINFDGSVGDITLTLAMGATLVLANHAAMLGGSSLVQSLHDENIEAVIVTPSALMAAPFRELPSLRALITAGEALPAALVDRWAPGRRFYNVYGPTEATVAATFALCESGAGKPSIGRPLDHAVVYILDGNMHPVPCGVPGELYIGGPGVARGYLNRPELNAKCFIDSPFPETAGTRLYKTGDRAKWRADGQIDYLGRMDSQVKLRGYRIELGEIEVEIGGHPAVEMAAVQMVEVAGDKRLVAYVVPRQVTSDLANALKQHLRERLPEYMVPATFVMLQRMPLNSSGKIDRKALPMPAVPVVPVANAPTATSLEQAVAAIWKEVLGPIHAGVDTPFFDVGGHSLALARVQAKLHARFEVDIELMTMLRLPTIRKIAAHLSTLPNLKIPVTPAPTATIPVATPEAHHADAIAVIGMAIRAPGIQGPDELWEVVRTGRETIREMTPEALIAAGADPQRVRHANFMGAEGILDEADHFDAAFFGYTDADAKWMDPQQRLFLECAHEALEHAGYDPRRTPQQIGVFAGSGAPRYWLGPVNETLGTAATEQDRYRAQTLNAVDFLATRVAFKLGLRGPAVVVQTACSTSLAAVHTARQNLLTGDCDIALAGGVSLSSLGAHDWGYLRVEGGIESADGHCRPFDSEASGMVKSSGVAIVVLKRLADAIADRDTIHAVIRGSAMNNDGSDKLGFTAPSEDGVAAVVEQACRAARVDPASIEYVEAHGTGTRLGDPTEVRALTRAYRKWTDKRGYCALGAIKANIGHLDAAAGAAGLIKATLVLSQQTIPPLTGYRQPNPLLDLPSTPFFVSDKGKPWPSTNGARRAAVSSLGIGGTNVHVVLEQAPVEEHHAETRPLQLLCVSAKSETALTKAMRRLRTHLGTHSATNLADAAYTLAVGRAQHPYRSTMVCRNIMGAVGALNSASTAPKHPPAPTSARPIVFLFPGHGAQHLQMGLDVYRTEPVFRAEVDRCFEIVLSDAGLDLRPLLVGDAETDNDRRLDEMRWAQPFMFAIEYALAKQLIAWGVRPAAMLGHSLGEYVAACIAGVFSLRDALALVVTRGRLMDETPAGAMLTAFTDAQTIAQYLVDGVTIGTYAPHCVVLSGTAQAIDVMRTRLATTDIETNDVRVSRASHSPLMHGIRDEFRKHVSRVHLDAPTIPIVSNTTGKHLTAEQATSADAWTEHLCQPVRLSDGFDVLLDLDAPVFIEIGPENALSSLLRAHPRFVANCDVVATLPSVRKRAEPSHASLLHGVGRLWELGLEIDWQAFYAPEKRRRIPLPTYVFDRKRHSLQAALADVPAPLDVRASAITREIGAMSIDEIPGLAARMDDLCAHLVLDFFARRLGETLGQMRSMEALRQDTGVLPKYAPMFDYLVRVLEGAGMATCTRSGQVAIHTDRVGRSAELAVTFRRDEPMFLGLVLFLEHCVTHYDEALTGEIEPIGVLYPDGTDAFYEECMRENAAFFYQVYMALARDVVVDIVKRSQGRKIRILEVGGGHGRLTWPLVEQLRGENVEYHFTDIGRSFLHITEREAAKRGISWLKAIRFDMNRAPEDQGFHDRYDVILGLDAVHVALDLPTTLVRLRDMLVPGGALICVEETRVGTCGQLVWGLAPGFWDIVGARGSLTMTLADWRRELDQANFSPVEIVPKDPRRQQVEDCGMFIAEYSTRAANSSPAWRDLVTPIAPSQVSIANLDESSAESREATSTDSTDSANSIAQHLWRRMLGVTHVALGANFFDLGGDSLLAVHFLAEFNLRTGRNVKMAQFMTNPSIHGLVALMGSPAPTPVRVIPESRPIDDTPQRVEQVEQDEEDEEEEDEEQAPYSLGRAHRETHRSTNDVVPQPLPPPVDDEPLTGVEMEIHSFLRHFVDRMCRRDGAAIAAMFTPDQRCVTVGVGEGVVEGIEAITNHYVRKNAELLELRAQIRQPKISVLGGGRAATVSALFDSDQTHEQGKRRLTYMNTRLSLVLEKLNGAWHVVHMHCSLPVGESHPAGFGAAAPSSTG